MTKGQLKAKYAGKPVLKRGMYMRKFVPYVANPKQKQFKRKGKAKDKSKRKALVETEDLPEGQVRAFASTIQPDRDEHMIIPEAFRKWLPHFLANPVFLLNHKWMGSIENHLGSILEADIIENVGLECLFDYDFDLTETCRAVYAKTKKGSLRGYSIGFYVHEWVTVWDDDEKIDALPAYARAALKEGLCYVVFTEVELVEISKVYIPSNRGALDEHEAASAEPVKQPERRSPDMEIEECLAKLAEVTEALKAQTERSDRFEKALTGMAEAVTGLAKMVGEQKSAPAPAEPEKKSVSLEDLSDEDLQRVMKSAVEFLETKMGAARA